MKQTKRPANGPSCFDINVGVLLFTPSLKKMVDSAQSCSSLHVAKFAVHPKKTALSECNMPIHNI